MQTKKDIIKQHFIYYIFAAATLAFQFYIYLSQSCIIIRYDTGGMVTDLRDLTLEVTGYKRSDIVGHYLKEILALTKNDMDNFDVFWNEIIQGVKKTRKFTRGETLYKETFTLITDEHGRPYKVISIAVPV